MNDQKKNNHLSEDQTPEVVQPAPSDRPTESAQPARKFKFTWQFAAGFLGWFLVNGLVWILLSGGRQVSLADLEIGATNARCVFPLNLAILALLFWKKETRQIGQGILAAYGINFVISLTRGLFLNAVCLVPFLFD